MRSNDALEIMLRKLRYQTASERRERTLTNVLREMDELQRLSPTAPRPAIWSIVIKSRLTQLAAAVLVIAGLIALYHSPPTLAYEITDVPRILYQARTLHVRGWACAHVQPGLYDPDVVRPGQKQTRALWELWADMGTGRMRLTRPGMVAVENQQISAPVRTEVYDGGEFIMTVSPAARRAHFRRLSPYQQLVHKRKNSESIRQHLFLSAETLDAFERTGRERIDSEIHDVWEAELLPPAWGHAMRIKTWISPTTGHVKRVAIWEKEQGANWWQVAQLDEIEYDASIPDRVFVADVPLGYASENDKSSAVASELLQNRNRVGDYTLASHACFTLKDGSVILGWSCTFGWREGRSESGPAQEPLFEKAIAGGDLPKLPVEFYTLSPIGPHPGVEYHGRHLACTRKGNVLYEWGLYVPDRELDAYLGGIGYNLHFHCNEAGMSKSGSFTLGEAGDIRIQTRQEFEAFVLGAMAELAEEGEAPAHVSYESALALADQVRRSCQSRP